VRSHFFLEPVLRRLLRCGLVGAAALLFVARIGSQSSGVGTPEAESRSSHGFNSRDIDPGGYLQFENGGFYADNSPDFTTLFGINRVTKLTVASRLQLLALSGHLLKQVELPAMLSRGVALEKSSPDFGQSYCLERDINLP
jgi:hypothetical protein